jgi:hypothetical protein
MYDVRESRRYEVRSTKGCTMYNVRCGGIVRGTRCEVRRNVQCTMYDVGKVRGTRCEVRRNVQCTMYDVRESTRYEGEPSSPFCHPEVSRNCDNPSWGLSFHQLLNTDYRIPFTFYFLLVSDYLSKVTSVRWLAAWPSFVM